MDHRTVTIKEVAKRAGVAISTVSRVLNGLDKVSKKTEIKVKKAIEELNYIPNNMAASLITGQTKVILIVIPDFINSFFSAIIQGVEKYLEKRGYYSMVVSTGEDEKVDYESLRNKFNTMIDGLIVIPTSTDVNVFRHWGKPCVIVDRYTLGNGLNAVVPNNLLGAYQLTETLIRYNHRKIAMITGSSTLCVVVDRLRGYYKALSDYGIVVNPEYICCESLYQYTGYNHTKALLSLSDPPTAIFSGNNLICEGCIQALQEMHLKIGEDISLVSYDDSSLAKSFPPGITVIDQPTEEMGKIAAHRLLEIIVGDDACDKIKEIVLDVKLINRGSIKTL